MQIKIVQASPPHTASTLLVNLIHGFISPEEHVKYQTENLIHKYLITRTHNIDVDVLINKFKMYDIFFVMSERNDHKIKRLIDDKYRNRKNVLILNYDELVETETNKKDTIIENIYQKFKNFFPEELTQNKSERTLKEQMKKRMNIVNETVERMKNLSFSEIDSFTDIHGSHRNRDFN